jgi:hypothetical protein
MKKKIVTALALAGSLAWVVNCGGSGPVLADSHARLVQETIPHGLVQNFELPLYMGKFADTGEQQATGGDYASPAPGTREFALGGDWAGQGRAQLAPASLPSAGDMDSRSRLIEPQWFTGGQALEARGEVDSGEAILPPVPLIPEPAALLLLGSVFLVLAAFGKKWKGKIKSYQ